jgi:hypothetical protein
MGQQTAIGYEVELRAVTTSSKFKKLLKPENFLNLQSYLF